MDVTLYENPAGDGTVYLVYDDGDSGIVKIDPRFQETDEANEVPAGWLKHGRLPNAERTAGALAAASSAAVAWTEAIRASGPLVDAGADLVDALCEAMELLGELTRGEA
jgi:hypothetical protein